MNIEEDDFAFPESCLQRLLDVPDAAAPLLSDSENRRTAIDDDDDVAVGHKRPAPQESRLRQRRRVEPPTNYEAQMQVHEQKWANWVPQQDDDEGALPDEFRYCAFENDAWVAEADASEEAAADPEWCFLCEVTQTPVEYENDKHYLDLLQMIDDNYGKMRNERLSAMVQDYYNRELRPYVPNQPAWRRSSVVAHIERHNPTYTAMTRGPINVLTDALAVLADHCICMESVDYNRSTGQRRKTIDAPNMKLYLQVLDKRRVLIKEYERNVANL